MRHYIAYNSGLQVMVGHDTKLKAVGDRVFTGRTVEHLEGYPGHPEMIFAAVAFDGAYRTADAGRTWQKLADGDVRCFAFDNHNDGVVYMGSGPISLQRSEDFGDTWEALDGMLAFSDDVKAKWTTPLDVRDTQVPHVRDIFVHPDDARVLFVLLEHGGILFSEDGGKTWDDRSTGLDYYDMHQIENYPGIAERFYVSSARGFFRSDDYGRTWNRAVAGMPFADNPRYCYSHEWRLVDGAVPRMIVCGGRGSPGVWLNERVTPKGHILLSDDGGDSWRLARGFGHDNPWMPWVLAAHPSDKRTFYCGAGDAGRGFGMRPWEDGRGAWLVSRDTGESWEPLIADTQAIVAAWLAPE